MKKLLFITALCCLALAFTLALVGCSETSVTREDWDMAVKACEPYGGVARVGAYHNKNFVEVRAVCSAGNYIEIRK